MKKTTKLLALLLTLLMALSLCACAASETMDMNIAADSFQSQSNKGEIYDEAPMEESVVEDAMEAEPEYEEEIAEDGIATSNQSDAANANTVKDISEKIIYSGYVNLETTTFDKTLTALSQAVAQSGGFIQDSSVEGYTSYNSDGSSTVVDRWAYYTVRVPSENFDSFMAMTNGMGNVTNSSRSAQNVTSKYTDYEARLNSLTIQEERLLDMLEKSGDLESLITLEARLSDVRYEIESIQRNLRNLDNQISYSTVNLNIREVEIYTPTKPVTRTFGEKMADAFSDGWNGFIRGIQNFCIWFAEALPTLVILAIIAAAVLIVVNRIRRGRKAKKQPVNTDKDPE